MTRKRGATRGGADLDLFGDDSSRLSALGTRQVPGAADEYPHPASRISQPTVAESGLTEDIPGASPASAVSVATLTHTTKDVIEGAFLPLWVRGEISDFKAHRNGHWYFCLRDAGAQIKCVMWSRDQRRVPAAPDDGMQIVALGQLTVYPARGDLQFAVKAMLAEGDGLWRKALEEATRRLEADGLLAPERKRPLPRFPRRIAVVTSPSGAALHDVVAVARRRAPHVEIVVVPAKVQGEGAPEEIVAALERVARWGDCDVVIVGRGGGAREDLWAFNDERVARAVAACPVPTISAVGHEIDVTLCDLVADLRAPTPSAAAEAAVPLREHLQRAMGAARRALCAAAGGQVADARDRLAGLTDDLRAGATRITERAESRLTGVAGRLHALSPLATLARGYAVATSPDGRALTRGADFNVGAPFDLRVRDGVVRAVTKEVHEMPLSALGSRLSAKKSPHPASRIPHPGSSAESREPSAERTQRRAES